MQTTVKSFASLTVAALFLFTLNLSAQEFSTTLFEEPVEKGPIATIEFEETTYDFGEIESGTIFSHVFTFTNTSDEPLVLSNAKGSCGCTVPQWPREPIMPGETASITVKFNSKNKKGKRNQRITLTANTEPAQTFLYLTGDVISTEITHTNLPEIEEAEEKVNPDCFAIFPNPTAEILKLKMEESSFGKSALISIYSKTGQLMAKREIKTIEGIIEFSVSHYSAGTYIANVQIGDNKPEVRCFVVVE